MPRRDSTQVWAASVAHLWEIADRFVVRTELEFSRENREVEDAAEVDRDRFDLRVAADDFVEDHLSLQPWVSWRSVRSESSGTSYANQSEDTDDWNFGVSIIYLRDRLVAGPRL